MHAWGNTFACCLTPKISRILSESQERPGVSGTSGQGTGTVLATVVAVDTLTNRVKVQTQVGQVIELETVAKDRQIGEQVTLIVPR